MSDLENRIRDAMNEMADEVAADDPGRIERIVEGAMDKITSDEHPQLPPDDNEGSVYGQPGTKGGVTGGLIEGGTHEQFENVVNGRPRGEPNIFRKPKVHKIDRG